MRWRSAIPATATGMMLCGAAMAQVQTNSVVEDANFLQSLGNEAKAYALQLESYATQVKTYIGDQLSWAKQAQQYATQLQQYAQEIELYENFFHYPSLGAAMGLLNAAGLGSTLPNSGMAVLGLVNGVRYGAGGLPQIAGLAGQLSGLIGTSYAQNHVYTPTDGSWGSGTVTANANTIAAAQGSAADAYADLQNHTGVLQGLRSQLLTTSDSKGVADLTAQVNLETAYNMNESAKIAALNMTAEAQQASRVQQDNEHYGKDIELVVQNFSQ
jgi:Type IV secretion system proteins